MVVCNGRGFMIMKPRLPYFFVFDHAHVLDLEVEQCDQTNKETRVAMTAIKKDDSRLFMTILLLFPSDVALNANFDAYTPSTDQKVKLKLRILEKQDRLGKKKSLEKQYFYPCFWEARVLVGNKKTELMDSDDSKSDLEDAMEGMKISK